MHRLFIAIRPPEPVCDLLLDTMEGVEGAHWQDADNLHVTLRFLGEVETPAAEDLALALGRVRATPFPLELHGVGHFEKSRKSGSHPHAVWAQVLDSAPLEALRRKVDQACATVGLGHDERRYVPHVTLARLNSGSGLVGGWLAAHALLRAGPWQVEDFGLFESQLTAHGSHYTEVVRYPLLG